MIFPGAELTPIKIQFARELNFQMSPNDSDDEKSQTEDDEEDSADDENGTCHPVLRTIPGNLEVFKKILSHFPIRQVVKHGNTYFIDLDKSEAGRKCIFQNKPHV